MKEKMNSQFSKKQGITIIALIITIIILLILSGVTINIILKQNGLLDNAKLARSHYENKQNEENESLEYYENEIRKELEQKLYLYNNGDQCNALTSGWNGTRDSGANFDLNSYNYIKLTSNSNGNIGVNVCTNKLIDISSYSFIKMEVDFEKLYRTGIFMLGVSKQPLTVINNIPFSNEDYYITKSDLTGTHAIISCDISNLTGKYIIGLADHGYNINIYSIWLE